MGRNSPKCRVDEEKREDQKSGARALRFLKSRKDQFEDADEDVVDAALPALLDVAELEEDVIAEEDIDEEDCAAAELLLLT